MVERFQILIHISVTSVIDLYIYASVYSLSFFLKKFLHKNFKV